jgi:hypothetical protein
VAAHHFSLIMMLATMDEEDELLTRLGQVLCYTEAPVLVVQPQPLGFAFPGVYYLSNQRSAAALKMVIYEHADIELTTAP